MSLSNLFGYSFEADILNRRAVAQSQIDQGKLVPPHIVSAVTDMAHLYPWMSADTNYGLANSGVTAYNPIARTVANLELSKQLRTRQSAQALKKQGGDKPPMTREEAKAFVQHAFDDKGGGILGTGIDPGYTISRGLAGDPVGALAGPGKGALPDKAVSPGLPAPGGSVSDYLKPVVRTAGLAANAGLESVQAGLRNAGAGINQLAQGNFNEALNPSSQTNTMAPSNVVRSTQAGQAVLAAGRGDPVDTGGGYLPDPNSATGVAANQIRRQAAPLINGHAWTLGRAVADLTPLEPDSLPFDVLSGTIDAGVAIKGDPTNNVLSAWSEARAAHKVFSPDTTAAADLARNTGALVTTARPSYTSVTQRSFFASPEGQAGIQKFADARTPAEVWRASNSKLPVIASDGSPMLRDLAAADTPEAVQSVLQKTIDFQPTDMPSGLSYSVKRAIDTHSWLNIQPQVFVQSRDPNTFLQEYDRLMATAHISLPDRNRLLNQYLTSDNPSQQANAIISAGNFMTELAIKRGADPETASKIGHLVRADDTYERAYALDQVTGLERARPGVVIDKAGNVLPSPELDTEALNRAIQFPSPRLVSRATSRGAPFWLSKPVRVGTATLDMFYDNWKIFSVAKPGTTMKITADSQLSLAVNGYPSIVTHPLHVLSAIVGANLDKSWAQKLDKLPFVDGEYIFGPGGDSIIPHLDPGRALDVQRAALDQQILDRLGHPFLALDEPGKVALSGFSKISRDDPRAAEAMLAELNMMRGDPLVQGLVQQPSPAEAIDWLHSGEGVPLRETTQKTAAILDENNAARARAIGGTHIPIGDLSERENAAALVMSRLDTVAQRTGNDLRLWDAVRSGEIDGVPLWKVNEANRDALPKIQAIFDEGAGPQIIKASKEITLNQSEREASRNLLNRALRKYFNGLLGVPDHYLNQIPGWAPTNWAESEKYVPFLDRTIGPNGEPSAYERFLKSADEANVPAEQFQRIKNMPEDTSTTKRLDFGEGENTIGYMAKADAIRKMENLTHNIHNRANAFNTMRFLFPFGDAFRLVAKRWATNAWNHPEMLRRLQQGLQEAHASGFFHKDPVTGEEVFTLPGSQWLTDQIFGVPVPLNGRVKGLNLIGEGMPGIGPAATLPASWFLPDTPAYDGVKDWIYPYGPPRGESVQGQVINQLLPGWLDKLINQAPDQKTMNNTVGSMIDYLSTTGDYHLHGPDAKKETARMLEDAKKNAGLFYIIKAVAQYTAPTSPTQEWLAHDKDGHLMDLQVMKDKYHKWAADPKIGPDEAMTRMIKQFGGNSVFIPQSFSAPIGYGVPTTKPAQDWARDHPEIRAAYPNTYGLFAPSKGSFDIGAFEDQFSTGERESLTPEHQIARAENRIGQWIYYSKRDAIIKGNGGDAPDKGQSAWLRDLKDYLTKEYPGFNSFDAMPYDTVRKRNTAISELTAAASDPAVASTDAAKGLKLYLTARASATKEAQQSYGVVSPFQAKSTAPLRAWLRDGASAIISQHPDFLPMWEQLFSHELAN